MLTKLLARVAGLADARIAMAGGVDMVELIVSEGGAASGEHAAVAIEAVAALGALSTRRTGVLFADREADLGDGLSFLAESGFAGVRLDVAAPNARLLEQADFARLAAFVSAARAHGLAVELAGGLEAPDVPRLLALRPDVLVFDLDPDALAAIRALVPREPAAGSGAARAATASVAGDPEAADFTTVSQRIFVRDFVLPVRIGAYRRERHAPQQVRFDVTADVAVTGAASGDTPGMGAVLSYDLITDGIRALVAEGHVDFAETLAERIARLVLAEGRALRVTVRVEKLDVGPGGVGVEITMERSRSASPS